MFSNFVSIYLTILLGITAVIGDYIVTHAELHVFQAIFDNATHGLIGGLSWFIICYKLKNVSLNQKIIETVVCAIIASLIDIDHFIAAKSFSLKDAIHLKGRPPFHCSTIPFSFSLISFVISLYFNWRFINRTSLIILVAFVSHHTRDATRRGYWFYPFGSTPPIPYLLYIGLTCLLPHIIYMLKLLDHKSIFYSAVNKEIV